MSIEQDLLRMKQKIDKAKTEKAQAEGALSQLHSRLETEFGIKDPAKAEARLDELEAEAAELEKKIQAQMKELEEKYGL